MPATLSLSEFQFRKNDDANIEHTMNKIKGIRQSLELGQLKKINEQKQIKEIEKKSEEENQKILKKKQGE